MPRRIKQELPLSSMLVTSCCLEPVDCLGSVPKMPRRIKQELPPAVDATIFFTRSIGALEYILLVG
jgi:hypothetical protein